MDKEIYAPSVKHAAQLVGGYGALAERVGVTRRDVFGWVNGTHTPSTEALLFVLDVVLAETRKIVGVTMACGLAEATIAKAAASAKIQAGPQSRRTRAARG